MTKKKKKNIVIGSWFGRMEACVHICVCLFVWNGKLRRHCRDTKRNEGLLNGSGEKFVKENDTTSSWKISPWGSGVKAEIKVVNAKKGIGFK